MKEGAIAGYPMYNIKVTVYDGKHHAVDSKEVAFATAGRKAFIDAVKKAKPVLLEPFVKLHIAIPSDMIGDVSSDMSGRRGRILGTDSLLDSMQQWRIGEEPSQFCGILICLYPVAFLKRLLEIGDFVANASFMILMNDRIDLGSELLRLLDRTKFVSHLLTQNEG